MYMPGMQIPYSLSFSVLYVNDPRSNDVISVVEKKIHTSTVKVKNVFKRQQYIRQKTYRVKYRKNN